MAVLVVAEHDNALVKDATNKTITAALQLSGDVDVLVAGLNAGGAAAGTAAIAGVRKVLHAEGEAFAHNIAEAVEGLIVPLMADYDAVLFAASATGKNAAPRVAAALDVSPISDIQEVVGVDTFVRPIYAGNALETVQTSDAKKVITVRTTAFAAAANGGSAPIETIASGTASATVTFIGAEIVKSDRPELAGAKRVVSGGRAMGSADEFHHIIEPLADRLGAAVGASRAAVDAGYAPNDYQVGQTGKVVAPELYVAVGISGAIQHLAGMKDSKVIVAINKDADAPIFSIADFGLVADYKSAVPEFLAALDAAGV
jgi:electron transfer flavoprotein alpha subunit